MPRKARIDAPGALHHIIVRGIASRTIFDADADRAFFVERMGMILSETQTLCLAWALIPNHFHLLLKTGSAPIATVMKRLLTGYAMHYNREHIRKGHLFQNRYKSILCDEQTYLLELVRYIHLNPLRARVVTDMRALDRHPYCGHAVIMGSVEAEWQNTERVLSFFGPERTVAIDRYRQFIQKGIVRGRRPELVGGGLVRSVGGWSAVKRIRRRGGLQKGDERILGDNDFVQSVLARAEERLERKYALKAKGVGVDWIADRVAEIMGVDSSEIWMRSKQPRIVRARSLLCFWAATELGVSQVWLSKRLAISQAAVSLSVARGRQMVRKENYQIGN